MPGLLYRCDKCKKLDFRGALATQDKEHLSCGGIWRPIAIPFRAIELFEEYERRAADLEARIAELEQAIEEFARVYQRKDDEITRAAFLALYAHVGSNTILRDTSE